MRIRGTYKLTAKNAGFICVFLWIIVLVNFATVDEGRAQESTDFRPSPAEVAPRASLQTMVQGTVAQYLMNPDGIVDGLLLTNNTIIRFPPHLGQVLAQTVSPQDVVRVEGPLEVSGTIHASSIVDLQSQRSVVDTPPPPKHPKPARPGGEARQEMSASGLVRVLTHARGDEIDGAVLSDGSIIHFRPVVGAQFSTLLQEGHPLAAIGYGTINQYGRSLEAAAIGPSLDQLRTITSAPGP